MPFTGEQFKRKHNKKLGTKVAAKAASIANAMLRRGVEEGVAIATANKRAKAPAGSGAKAKPSRKKSFNSRFKKDY